MASIEGAGVVAGALLVVEKATVEAEASRLVEGLVSAGVGSALR